MRLPYRCVASRRSTANCRRFATPLKVVIAPGAGGLPRRNFSSVDTAAADAEEAAKIRESVARAAAVKDKQQLVRPIFPWRHEGFDNLLPRLTPGTSEYNLIPFPTIQPMCAYLFLKVPFIDAFITKRWESELSDAMKFAFFQGVAGIISNVYKVPLDELIVSSTSKNEDGDGGEQEDKVDFCFPPTNAPTNTSKEEESAPASSTTKPDDSNSDTTIVKSSSSDDNTVDFCPQAKEMLDRPLRDLFESAHKSGRDQLRIKLVMQPNRTTFFRLYAAPFCSRTKLEQDPKLLKDLHNNGRGPKWETISKLLGEHIEAQLHRDGCVQTTIAAEVLVFCNEAFQVVDAITGAHLQGSPDGAFREVIHVVTFARTVSSALSDSFPYWQHTRLGRWQIVDIDDALGAKKWYHVDPT